MGTRCLTVFEKRNRRTEEVQEIAVLYRQMDGYPSGHGDELKTLLGDYKFIRGFDSEHEFASYANGMECLVVQTIAMLKEEMQREGKLLQECASPISKGPGQFYLHPAGTRNIGENYIYTLYDKDNVLCLKLQSCNFGTPEKTLLYDGPIKDFDPFETDT